MGLENGQECENVQNITSKPPSVNFFLAQHIASHHLLAYLNNSNNPLLDDRAAFYSASSAV